MTFGSLFSGIGGLDLGMERAGWTCKWQVEINPFCRRLLEKHWPDVRRHDDVTTFPPADSTDWAVDAIVGGFPCQDISYAGKGAGLKGERSGLWYEFARVVREIRPQIVVVENVSALLVRGLDAVLGTLAADGYDADWACVPAAFVGAPHIRDRVFVIAHAPSERCGTRSRESGSKEGERIGRRESDHCVADVADSESIGCRSGRTGRAAASSEVRKVSGRDVSDADGQRFSRRTKRDRSSIEPRFVPSSWHDAYRRSSADWWATEPDVGRMAYGIPARVDRLAGLGNAVVPAVGELVGRIAADVFNSLTPPQAN